MTKDSDSAEKASEIRQQSETGRTPQVNPLAAVLREELAQHRCKQRDLDDAAEANSSERREVEEHIETVLAGVRAVEHAPSKGQAEPATGNEKA